MCMVADMDVDMMAVMQVDMVADMVVDKVADMEVATITKSPLLPSLFSQSFSSQSFCLPRSCLIICPPFECYRFNSDAHSQ